MNKPKIYIASKASHRRIWREYRAEGWNIQARWIDTPDSYIGTTVGESDLDYEKLWLECVEDVQNCDLLILYCETGEVLKGALVEVGVALALHKPVIIVGNRKAINANGTWHQHPGIHWHDGLTVGSALRESAMEREDERR